MCTFFARVDVERPEAAERGRMREIMQHRSDARAMQFFHKGATASDIKVDSEPL